MPRAKRALLFLIMLLIVAAATGCNAQGGSWLPRTTSQEPALIRVHIQFTNQKDLVCYVKSLGLEKDAQVYTGGPSANNMYDRDGNVTGSFNYQQVMYMEIVPEENGN